MSLYTITANILAETTAGYPNLVAGTTHRAETDSFQVGGKGINVARMAERLQWEATAICFPGGHAGERCREWLEEKPFRLRTFAQKRETRGGWVVRAGGVETTFLGADRPLEAEAWGAAMTFLGENLRSGDVLAICGSIPGWNEEIAERLRELLREIAGKVFVAVDTYGAPLMDLSKEPIDLVKVNRTEIAAILGESGTEDVESFLRKKCEAFPVKRWVISDGSGPVWGRGETGLVFQEMPPAIAVVSAVGSGDVMLAGILWGLVQRGLSLEGAVGLGISLGAANAESFNIADFDLKSVL